ncbi:MAG: transposase, partial [Synergistaceae bacterium]|nr:transposase [Synergistaceae bacterium]
SGARGLSDTIKGVFPRADLQLSVVHLVRNSQKYVSWKYRKELARDLKEIYHAGT